MFFSVYFLYFGFLLGFLQSLPHPELNSQLNSQLDAELNTPSNQQRPNDQSNEHTNTECICLEPFLMDSSNDVLSLPCGHGFHSSCLLPWIEEKTTCPYCRENIPPSFYSANNITFPEENPPELEELLRGIRGFPIGATLGFEGFDDAYISSLLNQVMGQLNLSAESMRAIEGSSWTHLFLSEHDPFIIQPYSFTYENDRDESSSNQGIRERESRPYSFSNPGPSLFRERERMPYSSTPSSHGLFRERERMPYSSANSEPSSHGLFRERERMPYSSTNTEPSSSNRFRERQRQRYSFNPSASSETSESTRTSNTGGHRFTSRESNSEQTFSGFGNSGNNFFENSFRTPYSRSQSHRRESNNRENHFNSAFDSFFSSSSSSSTSRRNFDGTNLFENAFRPFMEQQTDGNRNGNFSHAFPELFHMMGNALREGLEQQRRFG